MSTLRLRNSWIRIVKITTMLLICSGVILQLWFTYNLLSLSTTPSTDAQKVSTPELDSATFNSMNNRFERGAQ